MSSEEEYRPSGRGKVARKVSKKAGKSGNTAPVKPMKDPNKPKAPLSSYMRFVNEKRASIKEDNPGAGIGDVAKIAGKMWKEVTDEEKTGYEEAYKKERKEYEKKMQSYIPPAGCKRSKSKATRDPDAPKKPMTAYFAWMNENRSRIKEENPGAGLGEVAKIAGAEWKDVDSDEKGRLEEEYRENMVEYKNKMKNYTPKTSPKKAPKSKPSNKKKPKKSAEVYDDSSDNNDDNDDGNSTSSLED